MVPQKLKTAICVLWSVEHKLKIEAERLLKQCPIYNEIATEINDTCAKNIDNLQVIYDLLNYEMYLMPDHNEKDTDAEDPLKDVNRIIGVIINKYRTTGNEYANVEIEEFNISSICDLNNGHLSDLHRKIQIIRSANKPKLKTKHNMMNEVHPA